MDINATLRDPWICDAPYRQLPATGNSTPDCRNRSTTDILCIRQTKTATHLLKQIAIVVRPCHIRYEDSTTSRPSRTKLMNFASGKTRCTNPTRTVLPTVFSISQFGGPLAAMIAIPLQSLSDTSRDNVIARLGSKTSVHHSTISTPPYKGDIVRYHMAVAARSQCTTQEFSYYGLLPI